MKKLIGCMLFAISSLAQAQNPLAYNSYASQISINVPTVAPTAACVELPAAPPTAPLVVKRTFADMFASFDLRDKVWTPHYDGGYNETYGQWDGYTNKDKRRQAGMLEQQLYVDPGFMGKDATPMYLNPFSVAGGYLTIRAEPTPPENLVAMSNFKFMSGVLTTRKSHLQTYGYFEIRAKVPYKIGANAAFWMVNADRVWPPEIDIFETPTQKGEVIQTTAHWMKAGGGDGNSGCPLKRPGYSNDFHQYGALWTTEKIVWYIDRVPVAQIATPPDMNQPMYMQMNVALGGTWLGNLSAAAIAALPADMVVDNVVAYSVNGPNSCTVQPHGEVLCI